MIEISGKLTTEHQSGITLIVDEYIGHRRIKTLVPCAVVNCNKLSNKECHRCDRHCRFRSKP